MIIIYCLYLQPVVFIPVNINSFSPSLSMLYSDQAYAVLYDASRDKVNVQSVVFENKNEEMKVQW